MNSMQNERALGLVESKRRIVVTSGSSPIAQQITQKLAGNTAVEFVRGVDTHAASLHSSGNEIDVVPFVPDHRPFVEYLRKEAVDTVIQCGLAPDRSGRMTRKDEADVIATMYLGAAIAHEASGVRNWVVLSSSSIYPIGSRSNLLQREEQSLEPADLGARASLAEAEDYARDVAIRNPHINVSILRLQQLVGVGISGSLSSLLAPARVPTLIGFDSPVQFLHVEDAVSAAVFASVHELAGVFNIASRGMIRWQEAVDHAGRRSIPVLPIGAAFLRPALRLIGILDLSPELGELLRFGHVVDTQKIEAIGWRAEFDQHACVSSIETC